MANTYKGIDYGLGKSNIDIANGIRYGVISVNSLADWVLGEAESVYPDKVEIECPECKHSFETSDTCGSDTQICPKCLEEFEEHGLYELEPIGWNYAPNSEYQTDHSEGLNTVFVTKSPYFTRGVFCSPCCPGAIDLDNPDEEGEKAYCFGHDMFEGEKAPYPVYRVDTGEEVKPAEE
jgi:hypothetical protein